MPGEVRKFSAEELRSFDGAEGHPAYVAYQGRVIDVTASRLWKAGQHMRRHAAGQDLTAEIAEAPHGLDVLGRCPQVGVLVDTEGLPVSAPAATSTPLPARLERFIDRHPFFQRHPHPMTVHFPIVFFIAAPVFTLLHLVTGVDGFDVTALYCLGAGALFSLVVIPTGFFTWWVNYGARPMRPVTIKIALSIALFAASSAAFLWRLADPGVAGSLRGGNILYAVLVFILLPMVVIVAWFGATLTFPLPREKRTSHPLRPEGD
jgi:predicted heme/steroid binding protein/uncharacterized membrane protein